MRVAVITPDPVETLRSFVDANDLGYPLLSDLGGKVVERFGLLNPNIPPNPRQAPGIPFPGQFLLAPGGAVVAKAFTGDLRHRVSGSALVFEELGPRPAVEAAASGTQPDVVVDAGGVRATITRSTTRLFGGQEFAFAVDLEIAQGWHVYADSAPAPYVPLRIDFDTDGALFTHQTQTQPEPTWITFGATGESLPVHEGRMRIAGRARLRWSPPPSMFAGLDEAVRRRAIEPGRHVLPCALQFQACNEWECLPPRTEAFKLHVDVEPHVRAQS